MRPERVTDSSLTLTPGNGADMKEWYAKNRETVTKTGALSRQREQDRIKEAETKNGIMN